MKKQHGFIIPLALSIGALVLIAIGGTYIYNMKKTEPVVINPNNQSLSDEVFIQATEDPEGKVIAHGDVDGDGFQDAIVEEISCGASCSVSLAVVLNNNNSTTTLIQSSQGNFAPAYNGSGATKSSITNISIENGIISLTGNGLACKDDNQICTEAEWNKVKTIEYRFENNEIVQITPEAPRSPTVKPTPSPTQGKCYVGGCSSQLCSDQPNMASTCEWTESYGCYKTATCERQANGQCGWTSTPALQACLSNAR